jgi:phospholipid/cholesterol/gamma-HCH transport system substrate-binding protein
VITRRTRLQLLAFAVVALMGISYVGFNYVGLDRLLLGTGYEVEADFADSGGIFVNAEVTYRGVAVGRVSDLQLTEDGVRVTLTIDPDTADIPADTEAVVATRSAVGEQYVDLRPADDDAPYLADGAVIPVERTAIPIPVEQLLLDVDELVTSLDPEDLRVVVQELGDAFEGAGDDLARLIDNGDLLLARAQESLPQTLALITDGRTVLDTQVASRSAIEQWATDLRAVSDTLVEIDPDVRGLLVSAPGAGDALQGLLDRAGPGLGSLASHLDILNGVTIPRLTGIEQILVTYPDVVSGGFTVVRDDGGEMRAHFGFVLNVDDPRACTSGYVSTGASDSPDDVLRIDTDAVSCDVVDGVDPNPGDGVDETGSDLRGEQNIGRAGGVGSPGPQGQLGSLPPVLSTIDDLLTDILGALPFALDQVLG